MSFVENLNINTRIKNDSERLDLKLQCIFDKSEFIIKNTPSLKRVGG